MINVFVLNDMGTVSEIEHCGLLSSYGQLMVGNSWVFVKLRNVDTVTMMYLSGDNINEIDNLTMGIGNCLLSV